MKKLFSFLMLFFLAAGAVQAAQVTDVLDNAFTGVVDSEKHQVSTLMIPQEFSADARLVITLVDKTTYSLKLSSITAIPKWKGGNKYIYTIHLEKEEMKFSATIQPWVEKTGSGKADLDWD